MDIKISYEDVRKRYPDQMNAVMTKIRQGKSKSKGLPPENFEWTLSWYISGRTMSPSEMVESVLDHRKGEATSTDLDIRDYEKRSRISLHAKRGRAVWYSAAQQIPSSPLPPEIRRLVEKSTQKRRSERAKLIAVAPEERRGEEREIIRSLISEGRISILGVHRGGVKQITKPVSVSRQITFALQRLGVPVDTGYSLGIEYPVRYKIQDIEDEITFRMKEESEGSSL